MGKGTSRVQRTLKVCRELGLIAAKTEHWNHYAKVRQDLFGLFDVLAFDEDGIVGIQVTDMHNLNVHLEKIFESEIAKTWVQQPKREFQIHAWDKHKGRWSLRAFWLTYEKNMWCRRELS